MNLRLAKRVQLIKPSPTLTVTAHAAALKAAGKDIIGLGAGEPDFDTPDHIKQAAIKAIQDGFTKYTAVDGTPGLKKVIIAKFRRENGLEYALDQVLVSAGGKQSFYNLAQALLNAGDEVIIPAPYWVSYPDMVLLAEAEPAIIYAGIEQQFKITPRQLAKAITPKTRLLVLNSPSNPTGAIYSEAELKALGEVLRDHPQVLVVSDDIYEHILLSDAPFCNILNACPDLYDRTVIINGVSKSFSMTGWRIGYAAGPKPLIEAMKNIQSQSTSNPASISQAAAQMALEGDQSFMKDWIRQFKERHEFVVKELNHIKGVQCLPSPGAFYSFPKMQGVIDGLSDIKDDVALAEYILNETGVALVPGSAFGAPGYMRLSFATSMENLREALARMQKLLGTVN